MSVVACNVIRQFYNIWTIMVKYKEDSFPRQSVWEHCPHATLCLVDFMLFGMTIRLLLYVCVLFNNSFFAGICCRNCMKTKTHFLCRRGMYHSQGAMIGCRVSIILCFTMVVKGTHNIYLNLIFLGN